jgi:hypothetical protein
VLRFIYNMEGYQILLNVAPSASKSKYPFIVMDETQIKKTRKYIDLEFVSALKTMRREKNKKYVGGHDTISIGPICANSKCTVMFVEF